MGPSSGARVLLVVFTARLVLAQQQCVSTAPPDCPQWMLTSWYSILMPARTFERLLMLSRAMAPGNQLAASLEIHVCRVMHAMTSRLGIPTSTAAQT